MKLVRWKPPEKRYCPLGQRAIAVLVWFRLTKTVLCGELFGTSPRPQTTWIVASRGVVLAGVGSMTRAVMW
ncbi:MAG: hypothetical protein ACRDK5_08860 [Solirubrobacterales bacterium]